MLADDVQLELQPQPAEAEPPDHLLKKSESWWVGKARADRITKQKALMKKIAAAQQSGSFVQFRAYLVSIGEPESGWPRPCACNGDRSPPYLRLRLIVDAHPAKPPQLEEFLEYHCTNAFPLLHDRPDQPSRHLAPAPYIGSDGAWSGYVGNAASSAFDLPLRAQVGIEVFHWHDLLLAFFPGCVAPAEDWPAEPLLRNALQTATPAEVDRLYTRLPPTLRATLRDFQVEAVRFGLGRGGQTLLADEMGLGKTLQALAIAAAYANRDSGRDGSWPLLIVSPSSMRDVWVRNLERWLGSKCMRNPNELCVLRRVMDQVQPQPRPQPPAPTPDPKPDPQPRP